MRGRGGQCWAHTESKLRVQHGARNRPFHQGAACPHQPTPIPAGAPDCSRCLLSSVMGRADTGAPVQLGTKMCLQKGASAGRAGGWAGGRLLHGLLATPHWLCVTKLGNCIPLELPHCPSAHPAPPALTSVHQRPPILGVRRLDALHKLALVYRQPCARKILWGRGEQQGAG